MADALRTLIVDDEPLAVERLQVICAGLAELTVVGTASDGHIALKLTEALAPVLLDMAMPGMDGLEVARALAQQDNPPALVFVTAYDNFAVQAFDLDAVDYVLKPVAPERLQRSVERAMARHSPRTRQSGDWPTEFWVPHRSELIRIAASQIDRIDAERDYVRLHVGERSYLMLHTVSGLEARLDPGQFIRLHRSVIVRRECIVGLRHDGAGVWSAELAEDRTVRIGRTYLAAAKAMAARPGKG
jgi:two-component system, LytTR family, response regulator AlgR